MCYISSNAALGSEMFYRDFLRTSRLSSTISFHKASCACRTPSCVYMASRQVVASHIPTYKYNSHHIIRGVDFTNDNPISFCVTAVQVRMQSILPPIGHQQAEVFPKAISERYISREKEVRVSPARQIDLQII